MSTAAYDVELKVARLNTLALIRQNPVTSVINRPINSETAAGGKVVSGWTQIPAQTFTVIPLAGLVWNRANPTPDEGRLPDVQEQIIARWDIDLQKHDRIPWDNAGQKGYLLVTHIERDRHYRTAALTKFMQEEGDG